MDLPGLRSVRRNSGSPRNGRRCAATSPPSEALANVSVAGLRTLQARTYLPDFPAACASSVILGFRTCLPLRGSSGVSPDSLFTLRRRSDHGMTPLYLEVWGWVGLWVVDIAQMPRGMRAKNMGRKIFWARLGNVRSGVWISVQRMCGERIAGVGTPSPILSM